MKNVPTNPPLPYSQRMCYDICCWNVCTCTFKYNILVSHLHCICTRVSVLFFLTVSRICLTQCLLLTIFSFLKSFFSFRPKFPLFSFYFILGHSSSSLPSYSYLQLLQKWPTSLILLILCPLLLRALTNALLLFPTDIVSFSLLVPLFLLFISLEGL